MRAKHEYVLGLHPSSRGFGWIVFEGPQSPFDWGTADIRRHKNVRAVAAIEHLLVKYQPCVVAVECFDANVSRRAERIRHLYRTTLRLAETHGVPVRIYSRTDICKTFGIAGGTREGIAALIAKHIEALGPRLPKPRKIWVGEHPNMALFCAAGCALTYYATITPAEP